MFRSKTKLPQHNYDCRMEEVFDRLISVSFIVYTDEVHK